MSGLSIYGIGGCWTDIVVVVVVVVHALTGLAVNFIISNQIFVAPNGRGGSMDACVRILFGHRQYATSPDSWHTISLLCRWTIGRERTFIIYL